MKKVGIGAAAVGLALAAAMLGTRPIGQAASVLDGCPLTGDDKSPAIQAQDLLKNRSAVPTSYEPMPLERLASAPVGSSDLSPNQAVSMTGYLVSAKVSGPESCICHIANPEAEDYHLYIGSKPDSPKADCIVCEITGRYRCVQFSGVNAMVGKQVTVKGWLFCDTEHKQNSKADSPDNPKDWRSSVWEIHPVLSIATQ